MHPCKTPYSFGAQQIAGSGDYNEDGRHWAILVFERPSLIRKALTWLTSSVAAFSLSVLKSILEVQSSVNTPLMCLWDDSNVGTE